MTQLAILSASERRRFGRAPTFNEDERGRYFMITPNVRLVLSRIKLSTNRAGFLLQYGYFQASARFYPATAFRHRDIEFVKRVLKLDAVNIADYTDTVPRRHRQNIRSMLGWQKVDSAAREELLAHAQRYVANQEYPKRIFVGPTNLCWKRQWVMPAYTELAEIITVSFNVADRTLLSDVARVLTPAHVEKLEWLLQSIQRQPNADTAAPLTLLKRIDQSQKTSAIKRSLVTLALFRDHFLTLAPALDALSLSDRATDYYATWLTKADHQQISQFPNRYKTYLHLLAFIKHQFYERQDHAIDVLLKSVTAARASIRKQLSQLDQTKHKERILAIEALRRSQLSGAEFANGIVAITRANNATPNEKYYKIETLVDDYLAGVDSVDTDRFAALDADIQNEHRNGSYYELLTSLSIKLQRRVADVVRSVIFNEKTSDAELMAAIEHFKAIDGRVGEHPPSAFLISQDHAAVYSDKGFSTPLYKSLLFVHVADRIKSGHLNLKYSYRYRAIQDYLIPLAEWETDKNRILKVCGLDECADAAHVLGGLRSHIHERFRTVNESFLAGTNPHMSVGADHRYRVRTPKTDYESRSFIASTLTQQGIVPILDLLKDVGHVCHFALSRNGPLHQ